MMKSALTALTILFSLFPASLHGKPAGQGSPYWPDGGNNPLEQAHADYLQGNWLKMSTHARDALTASPFEPERLANLSALFDAAYAQLGGKKLPVDWKLPEEIGFFKVSTRKTLVGVEEKPREVYSFGVLVEPKGPISLKQLQVTRFPDQVMLDLRAGLGEWTESGSQGQGRRFFHLTRYLPAAAPPGLYLLTVEVAGRKPVQGWFLLGQGPAPADPIPKLLAPSHDDRVFHSAYPVFRWEDYRSPHYQPFEERKILLSVLLPKRPFGDALWFAVFAPGAQKITYGIPSEKGPAARQGLEPGEYWLHLSFMESRAFGDLEITRETGQTVPMRVEK